MDKNKVLLRLCLSEIETRLNWGPASAWTNDDFDSLSEKIFDKTGVRLSLSTLRRLWGRVKYDSQPNTDTLNALAKFAGYADWRAFNASGKMENEQAPVPDIKPVRKFSRRIAWASALVIMAASMGGLLALKKSQPKEPDPAYNYQLTATRTSDDLPNSVVFMYDAGAGAKDVEIQQSWDDRRKEKVAVNGHTHTSLYYYPGFYRAKLLIEGKIVKQIPVMIPSHGWKGIAGRDGVGGAPVFFARDKWNRNGVFSITADLLSETMHTKELNNTWSQFAYVRGFPEVDSADFSVTTILRNTTKVEQSLCRKICLVIMGSNYPLMIPLSNKGCISDIDLFAGDTVMRGKQNDLSRLGCDFSKTQQLSCRVRDGKIFISLNGSLLFSLPYEKSMGAFMGVRTLFEGGGEMFAMQVESKGKTIDLMKEGSQSNFQGQATDVLPAI